MKKSPKYDKNSIKDELILLKRVEAEISKLERRRVTLENRLVKEASGSRKLFTTKHARRGLGSYALRRFRRRQLSYYIVTTIGVLMVWVGAWKLIDNAIPNPWISLAGGLFIVWVTRHYH